jgi:hypothetical protein
MITHELGGGSQPQQQDEEKTAWEDCMGAKRRVSKKVQAEETQYGGAPIILAL